MILFLLGINWIRLKEDRMGFKVYKIQLKCLNCGYIDEYTFFYGKEWKKVKTSCHNCGCHKFERAFSAHTS